MDKGGRTHTFEKHSGYCVLTLTPAMNGCQWGEIERIGNEVLKDLEQLDTPHLIVDLSELEYIGSSMVALVVRIWKLVKAKNARMVVVNKNPLVLEVFKIAKLDEVWEIVEYREDALDVLNVNKDAKAERGETTALMIVAILAALVSDFALVTAVSFPGLLVDPLRQILIYASAGAGTALGLLFALRSQGGRLLVGIVAVLMSVGVMFAASAVLPANADAQEADANIAKPESKTPAPDDK